MKARLSPEQIETLRKAAYGLDFDGPSSLAEALRAIAAEAEANNAPTVVREGSHVAVGPLDLLTWGRK